MYIEFMLKRKCSGEKLWLFGKTERVRKKREESGQGVSNGGLEMKAHKKDPEESRTTFGTVGSLGTSSNMVPRRDGSRKVQIIQRKDEVSSTDTRIICHQD